MLYIIRHGQTELNRLRIAQGRGVDSPLNDTGLAQAAAFYRAYKNHPFEHIYLSLLQRTAQTVQNFTQPKTRLAGLDEISWGSYENKTEATTTGERHPDFKKVIAEWKAGNLDAKLPAGESINDIVLRLSHVIPQLRSHKGDVLVCTHGRTMRVLLCLLTNRPLTEQEVFVHSNTCLYIVDGQNVVSANNTQHLLDFQRQQGA